MTESVTTTFVDDSISVQTTFPRAMSGVNGMSVSAVADPSIASFLAKPYLVSQVAWTAANASNTNLISYVTSTFTSPDIFASKLKGFSMYRGTMVARLVINAQPFQAGRLLMHVVPFVQASPSYYLNAHNIDLTQKTQHPSVELDCRDTTAEIEIPWVGPTPWCSIVDPLIDWGNIYVDVLSPLLTGTSGSTTVEASLFIYLKDAEFAAPIVPQSGDKSVSKMKRTRKTVSTEAENDGISQGKPISNILRMSARVAEFAAGVPMLSSFAAPASWVLDASANLASKFGWSKPNLVTPPQYVVLRPLHNMGNCSGTSQAEPLALSADPMVSMLPGFGGTDIDEMSWNYIKSVPSFLERFSFDSASAVGTNVYTKHIGPGFLYNSYSSGVASPNTSLYRTYPPFCYISNIFANWRGGIVVTIKMVKTDYHSGRLLVTWTPNDVSATTPTLATSAYSMRTIIDIRDVTEVEITLPYMLDNPWQQFDLDMGQLDIIVLNTLQGPNTVGSTIDCLVYYHAAPDFDLAAPNSVFNQTYVPNSGDKSAKEISEISCDIGCLCHNIKPQSGDKPNTKVAGVIGNDTSTIPAIEEFTIGEKFTSVKQLISRYSRMYFAAATMDNAVAFRMYPWSVGGVLGTPAIATGSYLGDMYSYLAPGYALARGGMRYNINCSNSVLSQVDFSRDIFDLMENGASATVQYGGTTLPNSFANGSNATSNIWTRPVIATGAGTKTTANPAVFVQSTNGIEVYVPQYNNNPSRLIPYDVTPAKVSNNYPYYTVPFNAISWDSLSTVTNKKIYRAAAEDAQLGYFIGFPASLIGIS